MRQQLLDKLLHGHLDRNFLCEILNRLSAADVEDLLKQVLLQEEKTAKLIAEVRRHCAETAEAARREAEDFALLQSRVPWARTKQQHHQELASLVTLGRVQIRCYELPTEGEEVPLSVFEGGGSHQDLCRAAARWLSSLGLGWTVQNRRYGAGLSDRAAHARNRRFLTPAAREHLFGDKVSEGREDVFDDNASEDMFWKSTIPRVEPRPDRLKHCTGSCGEGLPVECFQRDSHTPDGRRHECRACRLERRRELAEGAKLPSEPETQGVAMTEFHKLQPRDGDVVLTCGHGTRNYHWFQAPNGLEFVRPDGTRGVAGWIICCDGCYVQHGAEPTKIKISGDGVWQGDAPVIRAGD